jgi:hypothetical protein
MLKKKKKKKGAEILLQASRSVSDNLYLFRTWSKIAFLLGGKSASSVRLLFEPFSHLSQENSHLTNDITLDSHLISNW